MHAVIRRYRVRLGTVEQAVRYAEKEFVPLARRIPGFVACYLLNAGNDVLASIGMFRTQEGAEAAVQLQHDWFRDEWSSFRPLPPEVVAGEVLAQAAVEKYDVGDRRATSDRRGGAVLVPSRTWSGDERRSGVDRRAGLPRRVEFAAQVAWQPAGWQATG
jgi:hypothetical protein